MRQVQTNRSNQIQNQEFLLKQINDHISEQFPQMSPIAYRNKIQNVYFKTCLKTQKQGTLWKLLRLFG